MLGRAPAPLYGRHGSTGDLVTVAGAVSLDVEVPVSGVRRIGTGPKDRREPTACSGSQRCENSQFLSSFASAIETTSPFASSKLAISTAKPLAWALSLPPI